MSFAAAIDRPLPLRMRADLVVREQWFCGRRHFVIKDPVALTYVYLAEQEHFVLQSLDGETSPAQVQERFRERFAPQQLPPTQLHSFVSQLHRQALVLSDAPGQGTQLADRQAVKTQFNLLRLAEQLLALRWRGIDPEPILAWLQPAAAWLFSWWGFTLWLAIVAWAVTLVVTHLDAVTRRLPDAAAWLAGGNLVWLGVATILVKTLHELGHALAARRLGCRCHEIGIQLFFLLPCLYTNVSDVWLVPSKWRRIAVSAAGIYVELLLAAVATLVWWAAEPGVLSSLCLNVMLVASLGTLVLNGNPLMRYDGYYILADLMEVPNLEQQSRTQLVAWLARWCLGIEGDLADDGLSHRSRPLLAAYAAAAMAYRAAVLVGVFLASRALLAPLRLEPLSDLLLAGAVLGMIVPLAVTGGQFIVQTRRRNQLRPYRVALAGAVAIGLLAAFLFIPFPQRITAPVVIESRGASRVYVTVPGTVMDAVPAGTRVRRGEMVARLESPELRREVVRLESESRQQELHLSHLETARGEDAAAAAAIPAARQTLTDLSNRLAQLRELIGRLEITAPQDGIVLPPPQRQKETSPRQLAAWTGTPLDPSNRGSYLETGTLICLIGAPGDIEAVAVVEQSDVSLVQSGRAAHVAISRWPHGAFAGSVEQVARIDADDLPLHLAATGAIPRRTDAHGSGRPLQTTYQVRIRLTDPPPTILPGSVGQVQIVAPPQTLAARLSRWLSRTFRFEIS